MGNDLDLALALLADGDAVAQVVGASVDLDAVLKKFFKRSDVEDLVAGWLLSVDDELRGNVPSSAPFVFPPPLVFFWPLAFEDRPSFPRTSPLKGAKERQAYLLRLLLSLGWLLCLYAQKRK